jgi:hypothetical protein
MRVQTLMVVALISCCSVASAFAQATFTVGSTPVTTAASTGQTERAGDITLSMLPGSTAAGTITIFYGVPITNSFQQVSVTGSGDFSGNVSINIGASSNSGGILVINVPEELSSGSIQVSNVRVALAGTALSSLTAFISATGNAILSGQTSIRVINSIAAGLSSVGAPPGVAGAINSGTGSVFAQPVASATEGFLGAFHLQFSPDTTSVMVRFTLSANPPPGVTVTFPAAVNLTNSTWVLTDSSGVILGAGVDIINSSSSQSVYYKILTDVDYYVLDTLAVPVTITISQAATLPLPETSITYTAGLAPIGAAFTYMGLVITSPIPRYAASEVGPTVLFEIKSASVIFDADGDEKSDIAVWRPDGGNWFILPSDSPGSYTSTQWGIETDKSVSGDYDSDGESDIAVWRPDTGVWYILPSNSPGTYTATQWGSTPDIPVPADYDGDGKTDLAVWRPGEGVWYILPSNSPGTYTATQWGATSDIPVPGDYDGDGKTDLAVWRPSEGVWYVLPSNSPGNYTSNQWGVNTDIPTPGDYDGDAKSDIAVWRPSEGVWYVLPSASPGSYTSTQWGVATDTPTVGDYDGDGKSDIAVWRPDDGVWYIMPSGSPGTYTATQWGAVGDEAISGLTGILRSIP